MHWLRSVRTRNYAIALLLGISGAVVVTAVCLLVRNTLSTDIAKATDGLLLQMSNLRIMRHSELTTFYETVDSEYRKVHSETDGVGKYCKGVKFSAAELANEQKSIVKNLCPSGKSQCRVSEQSLYGLMDRPDSAYFSAMKKYGGSVWTTMLKKVAAHLTVNHIVETGKLQALLKDNSCALISKVFKRRSNISKDDFARLTEFFLTYAKVNWFVARFIARPVMHSAFNKRLQCCDTNRNGVIDKSEADCVVSGYLMHNLLHVKQHLSCPNKPKPKSFWDFFG